MRREAVMGPTASTTTTATTARGGGTTSFTLASEYSIRIPRHDDRARARGRSRGEEREDDVEDDKERRGSMWGGGTHDETMVWQFRSVRARGMMEMAITVDGKQKMEGGMEMELRMEGGTAVDGATKKYDNIDLICSWHRVAAVAPTAPDVDYPPSFDDEDDESDGSYESPTFHIDVRASIPRTHDDDDCDVRGGDDDDGDGSATTTTTTSTKGPCVG